MSALAEHSSLFHDPALPSLAEALGRLEARPDQTASRKARARTAVATISRLLHKPASDIPAHAPFLMLQFKRLKHRPTGLSPKSLANCKSELRHLVRIVCGRVRKSFFAPPSDDWRRLQKELNKERYLWGVSRLMAYCSANAIAPNQVDDGVLDRFKAALIASDEVSEPERLARSTIRAWNRLSQTCPAWPSVTLSDCPRRRNTWTLPPEAFFAPFRQDVERWLTRLGTSDPEAEDGLLRPCRPSTLGVRRYQLYQAASALVMSGEAVEGIECLGHLVRPDAFKSIMRYLRERQGGQPSHGLINIAQGLISVARHHVGADEAILRSMRTLCAKYKKAVGSQSRRRQKLDNFEDDRILAALLHLPVRLLEEAGHPGTRPQRAAYLAQIAVAIELEILTTLRRGNLASLNLNAHVKAIRIGGERRWLISLTEEETKNRAALTYELPATSVKLIERAFRFYRQTNGWLFPSPKGTRKSATTIGLAVKREVERRLGVPFHLHLFRSVMATLQVTEGGSIETARALLGDRSERVVRAHYTATAEKTLRIKAQRTIGKVRVRTAPLAGTTGRLPRPGAG